MVEKRGRGDDEKLLGVRNGRLTWYAFSYVTQLALLLLFVSNILLGVIYLSLYSS